MQNTDLRVAAVQRRIGAIRAERRIRLVAAVSAAACLALIIFMATLTPGLSENASQGAAPGAAASLFGTNAALGYLAVGILAFILGISVTLLCVLLHRRSRERAGDRKP